MSKNEINEYMEIDNANIANAKRSIKELNKIRSMIVEYEEKHNSDIGGVEKIDDEIAVYVAVIDEANKLNAKRKKQLKLLEQLEALETE